MSEAGRDECPNSNEEDGLTLPLPVCIYELLALSVLPTCIGYGDLLPLV